MKFCLVFLLMTLAGGCASAQPTPLQSAPPLPATDGQITLSVPDEPEKRARELVVSLFYPQGKAANINAKTGLMLSLHNWGGKDTDGAPSPQVLANTFDVVAIAVRYYQSSDPDSGPIPYDFGYLQAWDALRALNYVYNGLFDAKMPFDATRIYGAGGSGGGNVIQMANKFAPHTFACIVDLSGMSSLTDDMAYNIPGGSGLNARYSRDPASLAYLTKGMQEIRDLGNPAHLAQMAKVGSNCIIVIVHGEDDTSCLATDARRVATAMREAGLDVDAHFIGKDDIDNKLITDSGHSLGDRTDLLLHFAGDYLRPDSPKLRRLKGPVDFLRRSAITYTTSDAAYVMDYSSRSPVLESRPLNPQEKAALPVEKPKPVPKPTEETLFGAYVPVWPPRYPEGYNEGESATSTMFTTSVAGKIIGLRFYKFAGTEHTMWLYNNTTNPPTLLATLNFAPGDETASNWQLKKLAAPISITPGNTYMVWRSCPNNEKHGWTNGGKPAHGSNGQHLTGGGYYRGTIENNAVVPVHKDYLNDIVDADVVFQAD